MGRIDAVVADDGHSDLPCKVNDIVVQVHGERMGGVNDQADIVLMAESDHLGHLHRPSDVVAVRELDILQVASGGIPIGGTRFIEHLGRHAALSRSTKYENHSC